jgi:hypothetical protein
MACDLYKKNENVKIVSKDEVDLKFTKILLSNLLNTLYTQDLAK